MSDSVKTRIPVISKDLFDIIEEYKNFRHASYKNYRIKYDWNKMSNISTNAESTLEILSRDLEKFKAFLLALIEETCDHQKNENHG